MKRWTHDWTGVAAKMHTCGVLHDISIDRMVRAVEKVRERLLRTVQALESADLDYAIAGGNAVAAWVARVDETAVRNTRDVDIVLNRRDLDRARQAMAKAGFVFRHVAKVDMFLDADSPSARDAVHVLFAGEKVKPEYVTAVPSLDEIDRDGDFRVLNLEALVRSKLTSYRRKDQVHLLDLLEVGLIDAGWCRRFPPELAARLQELVDNPD